MPWFFLCIFFFVTLFGQQEPLAVQDIQRIMDQIFAQHVDKKSISTEIIKNSFTSFIDQADPDKIYFLQAEVDPYVQVTELQAADMEERYKKNDFSAYRKLNDLTQKVMHRAREVRAVVEKLPLGREEWRPERQFASDEKELKRRQQAHWNLFAHTMEGRLPQGVTLAAAYERQLRPHEDSYLYVGEDGQPLSAKDQQTRFVLHVLKSLAKSLDAHTAFFDEQEAYDMRVRLERGFEGVGIFFQETPQGIVVGKVVPNSPAAQSGKVQQGDQVVAINGISTLGMELDKLLELIRDKDPIELQLKREQQTLRVSLKKAAIVLSDDRVDIEKISVPGGIIGILTLHAFYQNDQGVTSEKDMREALGKLEKEGPLKGLILDLRDNSGGFLSQAVKVAGLFITNGVVVISKYANGDEKIYRDLDRQVAYQGPFVVLVSRATASAAEIVAQALQDYGVALIVGDPQTYGKGTIQTQTVTDKEVGSYFKVTVGTYYTVSGKTPQLKGVLADVVVPGPYAYVRLGEEYLDHTVHDRLTIPPDYQDDLADVAPRERPWYLHYYLPTLQAPTQKWRRHLPFLQQQSAQRIAKNRAYGEFLDHLRNGESAPYQDFQKEEAIYIVEDMIQASS